MYGVSVLGSSEEVRAVGVDLSSSVEFPDFGGELVDPVAEGLDLVEGGEFLDCLLVLFGLELAGELSGRGKGGDVAVEGALLHEGRGT